MASLSHPNICTFVGVSMDPEKKQLRSKGRRHVEVSTLLMRGGASHALLGN